MQTKNICHGGSAANDSQVPFVEIVERLCVLLPFQSVPNRLCGVGSALSGHLRYTRQRFSIFAQRKRQIADNENVGIPRNSEICTNFDPPASVRLRVSPR